MSVSFIYLGLLIIVGDDNKNHESYVHIICIFYFIFCYVCKFVLLMVF